MKFVDAIIVAFSDGEMVEVEMWRRDAQTRATSFQTYKATPWIMSRLLATLKKGDKPMVHCDFSGPEGDMTLHLEV